MASTSLFTVHDGDVIVRAGQGSGSAHDFRVHKFILSLASPVFKDMFALSLSSDQNRKGEPDIPIVNISDSSQVFDMILRFIYPGVEPPKIVKIHTLTALFSAAHKYNIASIYPVLRESLKGFLPAQSFMAYMIACRFGLLEEAKEAARVSTPQSMVDLDYSRAVEHISAPDLYRFVQFVQVREDRGLSKIKYLLGRDHVDTSGCDHWDSSKDFYYHLAKEVGEVFVRKPCLELGDLFGVFDEIPDPPLTGCGSRSNVAGWCEDSGNDNAVSCPLAPMTIRYHLKNIATKLRSLNHDLLEKAFKEETGRG